MIKFFTQPDNVSEKKSNPLKTLGIKELYNLCKSKFYGENHLMASDFNEFVHRKFIFKNNVDPTNINSIIENYSITTPDTIQINFKAGEIPKLIHFFWSGEIITKIKSINNIRSWKKKNTDYQVIIWCDFATTQDKNAILSSKEIFYEMLREEKIALVNYFEALAGEKYFNEIYPVMMHYCLMGEPGKGADLFKEYLKIVFSGCFTEHDIECLNPLGTIPIKENNVLFVPFKTCATINLSSLMIMNSLMDKEKLTQEEKIDQLAMFLNIINNFCYVDQTIFETKITTDLFFWGFLDEEHLQLQFNYMKKFSELGFHSDFLNEKFSIFTHYCDKNSEFTAILPKITEKEFPPNQPAPYHVELATGKLVNCIQRGSDKTWIKIKTFFTEEQNNLFKKDECVLCTFVLYRILDQIYRVKETLFLDIYSELDNWQTLGQKILVLLFENFSEETKGVREIIVKNLEIPESIKSKLPKNIKIIENDEEISYVPISNFIKN